MSKLIKFFVAFTCFMAWGSSFAETIFVDDTLRLGVRPEPGNTTKPLAIVVSGTPLTVLSRDSGYILVKTPDGTEGWVSGSYTTKETPPRIELEKLKSQYQQLEQEHSSALKKISVSADELEMLRKTVDQANQMAKQAEKSSLTSQAWEIWGGIILTTAIGGFLLGIRWHRNKIAQKLGGMQI